MFEFTIRSLAIGIGATAFMDGVAMMRTHLFGTAAMNYGLVGRWVGHFTRGQFFHPAIAAALPVRGERLLGWTVHYAVGVIFAALLLAWSVDWACRPTLVPALIVGVCSVAAPFLLMQPGMGAGIAASRTPNPAAARLRSVITHATFGVGLYVAGLILSGLLRCEE